MKKILTKSAIISALITTILFAFDGIMLHLFDKIPFAPLLRGGEIDEAFGVGWRYSKIYSFGNTNAGSTVYKDFHLGSLLCFFAVFFLIALAVQWYLGIAKKKPTDTAKAVSGEDTTAGDSAKKASNAAQKGETIFCMIYLLFAYVGAIILFTHTKGGMPFFVLWGTATLLLAVGDSFHLVPRILNFLAGALDTEFKKYQYYAGLGLMISSITMTIFYYVLYLALGEMPHVHLQVSEATEWFLKICIFVRIFICLFPQNRWFTKEGNATMGIIRNIPFVIIGVMMMILFASQGKWEMAIAIFISFACYLPVVLFAKKNPKVGMLMIPKTLAYMYMIAMGISML